jgi:hypothetical protein
MSVGASDADRRLALVQAARLARAVNATGGAAQRWLAEGCLHVDSSCWRAVLLLVAHLPLLEWGQVKPALDGASRFAQELHAIAPRGEDHSQQISCMLFVVLGELLEHWLTTLRVRGTIQPGRCVPISEGDLLWSSGSELETLRTLVAWVDLQAQLALQAAPRSTAPGPLSPGSATSSSRVRRSEASTRAVRSASRRSLSFATVASSELSTRLRRDRSRSRSCWV